MCLLFEPWTYTQFSFKSDVFFNTKWLRCCLPHLICAFPEFLIESLTVAFALVHTSLDLPLYESRPTVTKEYPNRLARDFSDAAVSEDSFEHIGAF